MKIDFAGKGNSIKRQTGWERSRPEMLLQDVTLLLKVNSFDYDLTNPDFVEYAHKRGCMNGAGYPEKCDPDYENTKNRLKHDPLLQAEYLRFIDPGSNVGQLRKWLRNHGATKEEFLRSEDMKYTLSGHLISDDDRLVTWKCICIARAQLQDCWEIYHSCVAQALSRQVA
jgi:hypothetical protein